MVILCAQTTFECETRSGAPKHVVSRSLAAALNTMFCTRDESDISESPLTMAHFVRTSKLPWSFTLPFRSFPGVSPLIVIYHFCGLAEGSWQSVTCFFVCHSTPLPSGSDIRSPALILVPQRQCLMNAEISTLHAVSL
jgi:hypothetical protein